MKKFLSIIAISISINTFSQYTIQWQKSLGGTSSEEAHSISQIVEGGFIVAGNSGSNDGDLTVNQGNFDWWVVKLDTLGNILWQKSYGGTDYDQANDIKQTTDGGYIVVGTSSSIDGDVIGNHGFYDCWILKLDANGIIQWKKSYGGSGSDVGNSIILTPDNGYIVAGISDSNDGDVSGNHGSSDYWILKLDSAGSIQWQRSYGGAAYEGAFSVKNTSDGGFVVAGHSQSNDGDVSGHHGPEQKTDFWVVKLSINGDIQWQKSLGGSEYDYRPSILQTSDNGYIIAGASASLDGDVTGNHGEWDFWIVKLSELGEIQWQKSLGGTTSESAQSIIQCSDGGYFISGNSQSNDGDITENIGYFDFWLVKIDNNGNIQWQKSLGGANEDGAFCSIQSPDNGYISVGRSLSNNGDVSGNHGGYDFWIVKLLPDSLLTGVNQINGNDNIFSVYPNPAKEELNISFASTFGLEIGSIGRSMIIKNTLGEVLFYKQNCNAFETIDVSGFASGVYFVRIGNKCNKFIRQ